MSASPRLHIPPLRWDGEALHVLDQTRLPAEEVAITLRGADDTAEAIRRLAVRGAPLIGVAAAYGLAMEVARGGSLERGAAVLAGARPTARNLSWAVERIVTAGPERARGRPRRSSARTRRPALRWRATAQTHSTPCSLPARSR
jgi:methylthioribose-1-phosphate isomerase